MSARSRVLRAVLVVLALCCGVVAGWLLDRAGRLPELPRTQGVSELTRELAQRRIVDSPTWLIALGGLICVALPLAVLAHQLQRIAKAQQSALAHASAVQSASRRDAMVAGIASLADAENATAQFIADALRRTVQLRPGCLVTDVLPAPYITVTDLLGARYLLTAHGAVFMRLRLVPTRALWGNISALSPFAHAEMQALWDAVRRLKALTHVAVPTGGDWQVFVIETTRAHRSIWQRLRATHRTRMLTRLSSRAALLSTALRVVIPRRAELRVAQRQLMVEPAGRDGVGDDVPALPAGNGGEA